MILRVILLSLLLTGLYFTPGYLEAKPLHVIVDPGHGGMDTGAKRGSLKEADITLKVGKLLYQLLKKDKRFEASLTRWSDKDLDLSDRADIANAHKGDLFVSIHVNASKNGTAKGAEFYFQNLLPPDEESIFLASRENLIASPQDSGSQKISPKVDLASILEDLTRNFRIRQSAILSKSFAKSWRGNIKLRHQKIRQAPFFVVSNLKIPSVLVELGFISNRRESKKLAKRQTQIRLAKNLYKGLIHYKETMDKAEF